MSDLIIRPLTAQDRPDWERLWTDYLTFYETTLPAEVYDSTFARLLSDNPIEFHGRLAIASDKPVGLVHFVFHRTCWAINNSCYLQDLYVDPDTRGTGAGRALIEEVYRTADAHGACNVHWMTQEFNTTARQLYDRIGRKTPMIQYARS